MKTPYTVSLGDGFATVPVITIEINHRITGTAEGVNISLGAVAEAEKLDALSIRGVAPLTPCIVEALICVNDNGAGAALDINVGLANETHADNADTIAESLFAHIDGNDLNLFAESDDGTTQVAATDSLFDYVEGTPFLVQWDLRNWLDIQLYTNGVNRLPATVFKLDKATGPLKLLVHVEKSADVTIGNLSVARLGIRTFEE